MNTYLRIVTTIAVLAVLSGCSYLPQWWGRDDVADAKTKAKRISVLKTESLLSVDAGLQDTDVLLPKAFRNTEWAQENDRQKEENRHLELAEKISKKAKFSIGKGAEDHFRLAAAPVVANNMFFAMDSKGFVTAYGVNNIEKRVWRSKILLGNRRKKGVIGGGLAYADGTLFVTTGFDEVVALNAVDGKQIWRKQVESIVRAAPTVTDGNVLVLSVDNTLYALKASDGSVVWTHSGIAEGIGTVNAPSPAYAKGVVLAPYSSGELYLLRGKDGAEAWSDNIAGNNNEGFSLPDIDTSPVIAYEKVFASSANGLLVADELRSGTRVWEQEISLSKTPWIAGNMLFAVTTDAELVAIFIGSGKIKWLQQLPRFEHQEAKRDIITWTAPVLAGGLLRIAGSHGELLSISPRDGSIIYRNDIPKDVYITPVVANGALYVLDNDGDVVQLR